MFLELSRTAPKFLERLMEKEVPEIQDGTVEIVSSARIPGERAKIALKTDRPDVDPIGAAVGQRGVRINAVSEELNGENIDAIEYSPIPEIFITRALSPAIVQHVRIENPNTSEQKALVDITSDQKAKAIGKSGINIRLASMLTGYQIELNKWKGSSNAPAAAWPNRRRPPTPQRWRACSNSPIERYPLFPNLLKWQASCGGSDPKVRTTAPSSRKNSPLPKKRCPPARHQHSRSRRWSRYCPA